MLFLASDYRSLLSLFSPLYPSLVISVSFSLFTLQSLIDPKYSTRLPVFEILFHLLNESSYPSTSYLPLAAAVPPLSGSPHSSASVPVPPCSPPVGPPSSLSCRTAYRSPCWSPGSCYRYWWPWCLSSTWPVLSATVNKEKQFKYNRDRHCLCINLYSSIQIHHITNCWLVNQLAKARKNALYLLHEDSH